LNFFIFHNRARATSSVINALQREKIEDFGYYQTLNFTMEDGNDGTMFSETISPILLHAS
jgi:hypothetical protein